MTDTLEDRKMVLWLFMEEIEPEKETLREEDCLSFLIQRSCA